MPLSLDEIGRVVPIALLIYLFFFLGPNLQHMELPRLGDKSELQLLAYTTATATRDLSLFLNPLSKARDEICILMDTSLLLLRHNGNSLP